MKCLRALFLILASFGTWGVTTSAFAGECEFRLDQHVFDAAYGWWNKGLRHSVVLFTRDAEDQYTVKGIYKRSSSTGRYEFLRDYFFEMPTYYGNGETQKIKYVRFSKGEFGCKIHFVGIKEGLPTSSGGLEDNAARYKVTVKGLHVIWFESEDDLNFSPVTFGEIAD